MYSTYIKHHNVIFDPTIPKPSPTCRDRGRITAVVPPGRTFAKVIPTAKCTKQGPGERRAPKTSCKWGEPFKEIPIFESPFCKWGFDWGSKCLLFWSYDHVNTI